MSQSYNSDNHKISSDGINKSRSYSIASSVTLDDSNESDELRDKEKHRMSLKVISSMNKSEDTGVSSTLNLIKQDSN